EVAHVGVRIADAREGDVQRARELGAALNLWTARSEEELLRALELGCDTLTGDDPAWAARLTDAPDPAGPPAGRPAGPGRTRRAHRSGPRGCCRRRGARARGAHVRAAGGRYPADP